MTTAEAIASIVRYGARERGSLRNVYEILRRLIVIAMGAHARSQTRLPTMLATILIEDPAFVEAVMRDRSIVIVAEFLAQQILESRFQQPRSQLPDDPGLRGSDAPKDLREANAVLKNFADSYRAETPYQLLEAPLLSQLRVATKDRPSYESLVERVDEPEPIRETVYFATDREFVDLDTSGPLFSNSGKRTKELSYGSALVTFPEKHREGVLELPRYSDAAPDARVHVTVASAKLLAEGAFLSEVTAALHDSAESDILLFVHGFAISFKEAVMRAAQIRLDTRFIGTAIAYSWPSRAEVNLPAYGADYELVEFAAARLAELIEKLPTKGKSRVHVLAHSLGCLIAVKAIARLDKKASGKVAEVILGAPDISADAYPDLIAPVLRVARRVTVYTSGRDIAIKAAGALRKNIIRVGADVQVAAAPGVDAIDASEVIKKSFFGDKHGYIFEASLVTELRSVLEGVRQLRPFVAALKKPPPPHYVLRKIKS